MLRIKRKQKLKNFLYTNEDNLTYNVFSRLLYLDERLFIDIVKKSFSISNDLGKINDVHFWPSWNSLNTGNKERVIPDLFLRFRDVDMIIEVKPRDIKQQSSWQWNDQITAYYNEYASDNKPLIYVPLGGMGYKKEAFVNVQIKQSYWFQLALICHHFYALDNPRKQDALILKDVLEILNFYGHRPLHFLNTLKPINLTSTTFNFQQK